MMKVDQRQALATLAKIRLRELTESFELDAPTSLRQDEVVEVLARSRRASFEKILSELKRDELKAICRPAGVDDSGRDKASIVDRILGRETTRHSDPTASPAGSGGGEPVQLELDVVRQGDCDA